MKRISSLIVILSTTLSVQAGTLLSFQFESKAAIDTDNIKTNTLAEGTLNVFIDSQILDIQENETVSVYDFSLFRIYRTPDETEGFQQTSIYSDIGFRTKEFQNRIQMGKALAAADIEDNPMDPVLMEHLFSLRTDEPAKLEKTSEKKYTAFIHKEQVLTQYSTKGTKVNPEQIDQFIFFLRTKYAIHPDILDALADLDYIPETLHIHLFNTGKKEEIKLQLTAVKTKAVQPERNLTKQTIPDYDPVFFLAHKTAQMSTEEFNNACESIIARASKLAEKGDYLNSVCLFVSYGLATGVQDLPPDFFEWQEKITANPDVLAMFSALSPQSKEDAEKAVETLSSIAEKADEGKFALLIFKANTLESLGMAVEATEAFQTALQQESAIVGAWKDLGDIYYNMYRPQQAWACWDTARALKPGHPFLEDVQKMEKSFQEEHPEFFLATP